MAHINCQACGGRGYTMQPKVKVENGRSKTVMVRTPCGRCGGTGDGR